MAEVLHKEIRKETWGYANEEDLGTKEMFQVKYDGIRPAPGYPSQPDHSEKTTLWSMLNAEKHIGMKLTESFAMWPASSVSALVLAHPKSKYFAVGTINKDQVTKYASRKGLEIKQAEKYLSSILNYNL